MAKKSTERDTPQDKADARLRDDADVRGEHDHAPARMSTAEPLTEELVRRRRQGQYAAGAEGTQAVQPQRPKRRRHR